MFGSAIGAGQPNIQAAWEPLRLLAHGIEPRPTREGAQWNREQFETRRRVRMPMSGAPAYSQEDRAVDSSRKRTRRGAVERRPRTPSSSGIGSWTLNLAKSKFSPGPAPKSATVTFSAAGDGVKAVIDGVGATGSKTHWEYTASFDGKPHPVIGNPDGDMVSAANRPSFVTSK